jgi:hypothetical protein
VIEALFVGMHRSSHDAVDAIGRWRLNHSSPALKLEGPGKLLSIAAFDDGIVAQPIRQLLSIAHRGSAEAKELSYLSAIPFDCPI